jgi:hypothetical protein
MKAKKAIMTVSLVMVGVLLTAATSYGQGVGNLGSLPGSFVVQPPGHFDVSTTAGPIPVVLDPAGPQWIKKFELGGLVVGPGQQFTVHESLVVAGNLPWQDWHEQVLTPGWDWLPNSIILANGLPAAGLTVATTPGVFPTGGSIDYTFNSLAPGTLVDIRKVLVYTGGATGVPFQGTIEIAQYPTPEPATLVLLAMGGIAMLRRRHRAS